MKRIPERNPVTLSAFNIILLYCHYARSEFNQGTLKQSEQKSSQ